MQFLKTHDFSNLSKLEEGTEVTLCGLITNIRQIPQKSDPSKFIRFVTLEDLTGSADCVCFHKKLQDLADILIADEKVTITGKVQHRGENAISILIDSAKSVDNSNIVTVRLKREIKYEELCGIKNILAKHHGDDPVMFKLPPVNGYSTRILTSPMFWVSSTNDFVNHMHSIFPNEVDISINSLDKPLESAAL